MNRYLCLILFGCCLSSAGCTEADVGESIAGVDPHTLALEARLDTLAWQNAQLEEEARMQHAFLEAYTRLINQTLAGLDAITAREGMLRRIRLDMEAGDAGGVAGVMETIEDRIHENLAAIERYIAQSKQQREALNRQRDELRRLAQKPAVDVSGLENTIRRLNDMVAEKERTIVALREEAALMLARIDALREANTELVTENEELREAYYVVGTMDELRRKDVIDLKRGFLSIGRRMRIGDLDASNFETVNVETGEIYVGQGLKRYQILSNHRQKENLYAFEQRDEEVYLSIHNPEDFWKISRYLVVEVKR